MPCLYRAPTGALLKL